MKGKMKAVRITSEGVEVLLVPRPVEPGVHIKITHAGICGTDVDAAAAGTVSDVILGHELVGVLKDGTVVTVEPLVPCGECPPCLRGEYNVCVKGPDVCLGLTSDDGGMADEIVVPERAVVPLPPGIDPADACLAEPLSVALHGLRRAGLDHGEQVAVIGAGTIGLLAAVGAVDLGCETAIVARHPHQRQAATTLGVGELELGDEYDLVVVATGSPEAISQATTLLRSGGRVLLLGLAQGPILEASAAFREIDAVTSMAYVREDFERALALLARRPELGRLITHRFPLDAATEAFRVAADRKAGAIKVVLEP